MKYDSGRLDKEGENLLFTEYAIKEALEEFTMNEHIKVRYGRIDSNKDKAEINRAKII